MIDLSGQRRPAPPQTIRAMAGAIVHRGPDEDGFLERPGLAFGSRRLSIVGLADGRQPIFNEDRSVAVVFNGELFDYVEQKAELEARGHRFATHSDTEMIPHRWEDLQEGMFDRLQGQFALALYDSRRQRIILGRDRWGICPLFWTRQGDWLLFASEVKAILASGLLDPRLDPRGLNQIFTFFASPAPTTMFAGVQLLPPGHYLRLDLGGPGEAARLSEHTYWEMDFPDWGDEERGRTDEQVIDGFEELVVAATERRLRADVPVVSYLSGGVDSSTVVALACKVRGSPIPTFTIRIKTPELDETSGALMTARQVGAEPVVVDVGAEEVQNTYPRLILAAEKPVIDTSTAALLLLAQEVHARGYKVALTGEGADEFLGGYPWHKVNRLLSWADFIPGVRLSQWLRRVYVKLSGAPAFPPRQVERAQAAVGGHNGWLDIYGLFGLSKFRFFSKDLLAELDGHVPYEELGLTPRLNRWHPFNRELYLGTRVHLGGHLLFAKGDRAAMHSSVEARYPFLDETVFEYTAKLDPDKWKLRGLLRDKWLLRRMAGRWLPRPIAYRRKAMFRAPFDCFHLDNAPPYVEQLLSPESLRRTGYFDPQAVGHWRHNFRNLRAGGGQRTSVEMGLVGVFSTQLWHHTFVDGSLADLPSLAGDGAYRRAEAGRAAALGVG
jgi:asparagine synthase (glutamine-hydrolysing)